VPTNPVGDGDDACAAAEATLGRNVNRSKAFTASMVLSIAGAVLGLTTAPALAAGRVLNGAYSNGTSYTVSVDVSSTYASGSGSNSTAWQRATLVVYQCSGTADCSNRVQIAATTNYGSTYISTGNPSSFGHTYQSCLSVVTYGGQSYSNYCTTPAAAG
jgi:hypothetical protein